MVVEYCLNYELVLKIVIPEKKEKYKSAYFFLSLYLKIYL